MYINMWNSTELLELKLIQVTVLLNGNSITNVADTFTQCQKQKLTELSILKWFIRAKSSFLRRQYLVWRVRFDIAKTDWFYTNVMPLVLFSEWHGHIYVDLFPTHWLLTSSFVLLDHVWNVCIFTKHIVNSRSLVLSDALCNRC